MKFFILFFLLINSTSLTAQLRKTNSKSGFKGAFRCDEGQCNTQLCCKYSSSRNTTWNITSESKFYFKDMGICQGQNNGLHLVNILGIDNRRHCYLISDDYIKNSTEIRWFGTMRLFISELFKNGTKFNYGISCSIGYHVYPIFSRKFNFPLSANAYMAYGLEKISAGPLLNFGCTNASHNYGVSAGVGYNLLNSDKKVTGGFIANVSFDFYLFKF